MDSRDLEQVKQALLEWLRHDHFIRQLILEVVREELKNIESRGGPKSPLGRS